MRELDKKFWSGNKTGRNSSPLEEPFGSLPCSQEPTTGYCLEPYELTTSNFFYFLKINFNIILKFTYISSKFLHVADCLTKKLFCTSVLPRWNHSEMLILNNGLIILVHNLRSTSFCNFSPRFLFIFPPSHNLISSLRAQSEYVGVCLFVARA